MKLAFLELEGTAGVMRECWNASGATTGIEPQAPRHQRMGV
jgi:hypothetical protein